MKMNVKFSSKMHVSKKDSCRDRTEVDIKTNEIRNICDMTQNGR
jgi:hypothetical protein